MNQNVKEPKTFVTLDGNIIFMEQTFEPLGFAVEKILPHGIFIFAGMPKLRPHPGYADQMAQRTGGLIRKGI